MIQENIDVADVIRDAQSKVDISPVPVTPSILSVGTATPDNSYSQKEVLDIFDIEDRVIRSIFLNSGIERRFLTLPPEQQRINGEGETQGQLLQKHTQCAVEIGSKAILACLEKADINPRDIRYLCCVTTTGFLTPGLSALICKEMGLDKNCRRLDVVGMGCNAGLNGMNTISSWAQDNPGELAVMLCVEICSAAYVIDDSIETSVVNSLFGDGASAVAVRGGEAKRAGHLPSILAYNSCVVTDEIEAMKFSWDEGHGKFNFLLAREVPYVVGSHIEQVIDQLLSKNELRRNDIEHWIIHSGGKKVIDSIQINMGLTANDVRHTTGVLRDYGNVSSGSFLFSLERLLAEGKANEGDYGVLVTMGPGVTIETALIKW